MTVGLSNHARLKSIITTIDIYEIIICCEYVLKKSILKNKFVF